MPWWWFQLRTLMLMSWDIEVTPGQEPAAGGGQEPANASAGGTAGGTGVAPKTFDEAYVSQLRSEAAANRVKASEFEAELKKIRDAQLSEDERLKARASELEKANEAAAAELRQERTARSVEAAARKLNIVDEEAALLLIQSKIEYAKDGKPSNIAALLEQLVKDRPYLVASAAGAGAAQGSAANAPRGAGTLTIDQIRRMSPVQIAALPDAQYKQALETAAGASKGGR